MDNEAHLVLGRKRSPRGPFVKEPVMVRFVRFTHFTEDCWYWIGNRSYKGYGEFAVSATKKQKAHRFAYEFFVGPIPNGMTIDHLCRNRSCVNPKHLEAVTNKVNILRGIAPSAVNSRRTHCIHGHEFTPENTYRQGGGGRGCIECNRKYQREWARKRKAKIARA